MKQKHGLRKGFWKNVKRDRVLIIMVLPVVLHFLIFSYYPMYGNIIAFKNYNPLDGINGSPWAGLEHFKTLFASPYFGRIVRNTLLISLYSLLWGFPIPVLFALMVNDLRQGKYKKLVQAATYVPYFISTVILVGILFNMLSPRYGVINQLIQFFGGQPIHFMMEPGWFRTVFIASGIWQGFGWSSIVYLAALSGVNPETYEAARIDGASKFKQAIHISIPYILPTIIITLILQIGSTMSVGHEKVILMYNPVTMEVADVISSYVYRTGLVEQNTSFASAVGLFNSVVNFILVVTANKISKKFSEVSLW